MRSRSTSPADLPPLDVDPVLVEQVLINVLDNAAKYAPEGTRIAISARGEGARVRIAVADEGPGIPARDRARVFDMFYRVARADGQRAGTGLGLAICKGIVDAHGGDIRALPAKPDGTGTRIEIVLPIANPESPVR